MLKSEFAKELARVGLNHEHAEQAFAWLREHGHKGAHDILYYTTRPRQNAAWAVHDEQGNRYFSKQAALLAYLFARNVKDELGEEPPFDDKTRESEGIVWYNCNQVWEQVWGVDKVPSHKYGEAEPSTESEISEFDKRIINKAIGLLKQFGQIVFTGPPGTGKTRAAQNLVRELLGADAEQDDRWNIAQFHPSYNYEDFVRGVQVKTKNRKVVYETVNRLFGAMCKTAADDDDENIYALIIDEINRANVSAVLGELIYALEYRGKAVKTPYLGDIVVPENLYIIGTMNTADRTIGQIDYAVRRRFAFVHLAPDESTIEDDDARDFFARVDALFNGEYMSPDFEANDLRIGHSYFLESGAKLGNKIIYQVVPILREYVRDGVLLPTAKNVIKDIKERAEELVKKSSADESEDSSANNEEETQSGGNRYFCWRNGDRYGVDGVGRTAFSVIKSFVNKNQDMNIAQLKDALKIPGRSTVILDRTPIKDSTGRRRCFKDSIPRKNGEAVYVSDQWGAQGVVAGLWKKFVEMVATHGYSITQCHFVNIGEDDGQSRSWADCRRLGFLAAGGAYKSGGGTYADGLKKLENGEIVFAFYKANDNRNKGVVGFGEIIASAVPIRKFQVDGTPLLEYKDESGVLYAEKYPEAASSADDERECEWVLAVRWIKTVSPEEAVSVPGQRSVVWHAASTDSLKAIKRKFLPQDDSEE